MNVMVYPCIVCVALLIYMIGLLVACLTVFCETIRNMLGVVGILLNVMELCIWVEVLCWYSKEWACFASDPL